MQSTGHASTQAASFVPMQGSAITYAIRVNLSVSYWADLATQDSSSKYQTGNLESPRRHASQAELRRKVMERRY
jgi:hypothetical protein